MKIGVLTLFRVANFGANLQVLSTYNYLKSQGHEVVFLEYVSTNTLLYNKISELRGKLKTKERDVQTLEHYNFLKEQIPIQIYNLHSSRAVCEAIKANHIEAVIIGSDAVAQHWPLFSTLKLGKHRPFWIEPLQQERRFPNPFWGCGFANEIPTAMMSVSSQNSKFQKFNKRAIKEISNQLSYMKYISVRDVWTRDMMLYCNPKLNIELTPDPVFALNNNMSSHIPSEKQIRSKFKLPEKYVLIGLRSQVLSVSQLDNLNTEMKKDGKECIAFNIDGCYSYSHNFSYTVPLPLSPIEWFALIKYASGYIGSNMHPIVSCLTNSVPCFSLDNWGATNFFGKKISSNSSKVYDILKQYELQDNWSQIEDGKCNVTVSYIVEKLRHFPIDKVKEISTKRHLTYNNMMHTIIKSLSCK